MPNQPHPILRPRPTSLNVGNHKRLLLGFQCHFAASVCAGLVLACALTTRAQDYDADNPPNPERACRP